MRHTPTRDGFALTINDDQGRPRVRQAFQIYDDKTVDNIVEALRHIPNVMCVPTTIKRDVFGKMFHVEATSDD